MDAAKGVKLSAGQPGGGAPALQTVSYQGDTNLADPIVAPFVTKTAQTLTSTGRRPARHGDHHPGQQHAAVGQRVRQRPRRRVQRTPPRLDDRTALPAASAAVPAAEAAGIHKQFGSTQALRGVDLTLWPGRCLGLVGRNGAGKSTLVSILSGIYPR